jgi:hypothetical protein
MEKERIEESTVGSNVGGELTDEKIDYKDPEPYDTKTANITGAELPLYPVGGPHDGASLKDELSEGETLDLYMPFPIDPTHEYEPNILTLRSLLTGIVLGSLVNASNLYLGKPSQIGFLIIGI